MDKIQEIIKEKAMAYDEAIERAKELLYVSDKNSLQRKTVERVLPELIESEDERIRENIITYFKAQQARLSTTSDTFTPYPSWIAWLKKQGEHKFSDKKPKFKVGDIIRRKDGDGLEWTVEEVLDNGYYTIVCADRDDFIQLDDKWELVEQKPAWSEEDKNRFNNLIFLVEHSDENIATKEGFIKFINKLKSLKPQSHQNSSEEQVEEDERIRKAISQCVEDMRGQFEKLYNVHHKDAIAWLEKQSGHAKFRDSIQVGDKITRNQDGVLVNLSQLKRVANKVKPKFKIGDWIIDSSGVTLHIINVEDDYYVVENPYVRTFNFDRASADLSCHLWSIQYAEPGDVLVAENGWTCIFRKLEQKTFQSYCFMDSTYNFYPIGSEHTLDDRICGKMYPATREQRDLFFSKMRENGYEWDSKYFKLTK